MVSLRFIIATAVSATLASAHMELTWPPALRSKYNPNTAWADIGEFLFFVVLLGMSDTRADR